MFPIIYHCSFLIYQNVEWDATSGVEDWIQPNELVISKMIVFYARKIIFDIIPFIKIEVDNSYWFPF